MIGELGGAVASSSGIAVAFSESYVIRMRQRCKSVDEHEYEGMMDGRMDVGEAQVAGSILNLDMDELNRLSLRRDSDRITKDAHRRT